MAETSGPALVERFEPEIEFEQSLDPGFSCDFVCFVALLLPLLYIICHSLKKSFTILKFRR